MIDTSQWLKKLSTHLKLSHRMKFFKKPLIIIFITFLVVAVSQVSILALEQKEISYIAERISVGIEGDFSGSGVIIGEKNVFSSNIYSNQRQNSDTQKVYQVITAWHIVESLGKYSIRTFDGKIHAVNPENIQRIDKIDIAIIEFTSQEKYPVAKVGDSAKLKVGAKIFYAGYPNEGPYNTRGSYYFIPATVISLSKDKDPINGYNVSYDGAPLDGMSGGPVLNENGEVIVIHGATAIRPIIGRAENYGISSDIFKKWPQTTVLAQQENIFPVQARPIESREFLNVDSNIKFIWPTTGIVTGSRRWGKLGKFTESWGGGESWMSVGKNRGINIPGPIGTPIIAAADGIVVESSYFNYYGNTIEIQHINGISTRYAHNNRLMVYKGQSVKQGQQIAERGNTGRSSGPHLYFEIIRSIE
jgi:Peptidase family M23/Trypsin-like peptidase domain